MAENGAATGAMHEVAFDAFGVFVVIGAPSAEILARVEDVLPPGCKRRTRTDDGDDYHRFDVIPDGATYNVRTPSGVVAGSADVDIAIEILDARLRNCIASQAPHHVFVHAGVVGHRGRAIVIPGFTFSGKTTLVAELVRAGAAYYSDEFGVLDDRGLVHPYAKPLSIRMVGREATDHPVASLGGVAGTEPLPLGLVVATTYRPGARWQPRRLSAGDGMLVLLANTLPAQERPGQSLAAIRRAVDGAVVLEGERGEAGAMVGQLLDSVPI